MKKKIKDLTQKERIKICEKSKGCDYCVLKNVCLIPLDMSSKEKKKFYKELNREIEL